MTSLDVEILPLLLEEEEWDGGLEEVFCGCSGGGESELVDDCRIWGSGNLLAMELETTTLLLLAAGEEDCCWCSTAACGFPVDEDDVAENKRDPAKGEEGVLVSLLLEGPAIMGGCMRIHVRSWSGMGGILASVGIRT